ncbi:hypothetical protein ACFLXC_05815, partial [Chloroflexota bacterium]
LILRLKGIGVTLHISSVKQIALSPHIGQIPCLSFNDHILRQRLQMPLGFLSGADSGAEIVVTIYA